MTSASPAGRRHWWRALGVLLTVLAIAWIVWTARDIEWGRVVPLLSPKVALAIFCLMIVYATALLLLVFAWHVSLGHRGERPDWRTTLAIYGQSTLAKYLPGGLFHFVSRQLLTAAAGMRQGATLRATFFEVMFHLIASAGLLLGAALIAARAQNFDRVHEFVIAVSLVGIGGAAIFGLIERRRARLRDAEKPGYLNLLALALALQTLFFLFLGLLPFGLLLLIEADIDPADIPTVFGAALGAWLVSFVVPGVPGGVGVREAAFVALAQPVLDPGMALFVTVALRIVTTGGDVILGMAGHLAGQERRSADSSLR